MMLRNLNMFGWTSGFHNPLAHTHFNMFVDEWMSANETPVKYFFTQHSIQFTMLNSVCLKTKSKGIDQCRANQISFNEVLLTCDVIADSKRIQG